MFPLTFPVRERSGEPVIALQILSKLDYTGLYIGFLLSYHRHLSELIKCAKIIWTHHVVHYFPGFL